jgi:3-dehydroquinate synthase
MKKLNLNLGEKSYPIYIGENLLSQADYLTKHITGNQVMIVSNTTVAPLYIDKVKSLLTDFEVCEVILPDGEQYKNLDTVNQIFTNLLENRFDRSSTLIALGGGVVGDMTGYAAACYQRGVNFIQIPTTLLSQVDSSVGGKTGVNHPLGKNMIGAFYQPKAVIIDVDTLNTLPNREFSAGMAEVIKYGLLGNENFLSFIEKNVDSLMNKKKSTVIDAIYQSCKDKANIVAEDELEAGKRALLNLGHTFGHAIENSMGYGNYLHGEAISIGMYMAAVMSEKEGFIDQSQVSRVKSILENCELPTRLTGKINFSDFSKSMSVDKKVLKGKIRLVLLKPIGAAFISDDYHKEFLDQTIKEFC